MRASRWLKALPGATRLSHSARTGGNRVSYYRDFLKFRKLCRNNGLSTPLFRDRYPCLGDGTGIVHFDRHYIYHTAWAARILETSRPEKHIDISSSLYFVALCSAFVPMEHYDFRAPLVNLSNLTTGSADLINLPFKDNSLKSLSCMHVVEHVGLGRYGEPLDPPGDLKAIRELQRVVAPGGQFLFAVPIGRQRVCFNAHRIYSYDQIMELFKDFELRQFCLVPDDSSISLIESPNPALVHEQEYGCGCFWFIKGESAGTATETARV
jgi:SAM-dependent methyltransferase